MSDDPTHHIIKVRDEKGNELSMEEVEAFLRDNDRSLPLRNWLDLGPRVNGLFVYDIAVDLERLFTVSTNQYDPELTIERIDELKETGWSEKGDLLIAPEDRQRQIIEALSQALVNWRITSNQSRTFSPQGTMALALSHNANSIVNAIRADLKEEQVEGESNAHLVIDETISEVRLFIAPAARGFIREVTVDNSAMENAVAEIKNRLQEALITA